MKNKSNIKAWLSAARLRTLPLSISGIIMGSAYSYFYSSQQFLNNTSITQITGERILIITGLALLTTLGFQVLSNFANDYGDGVKGTDNEQRLGPVRAIQSGMISPAQMKKAVIITAIISFISALLLIYISLGIQQIIPVLIFVVLGIAAIWAAIKYTVGDNAYGYSGLGDLFVFIFFGPVSVLGVFYLISNTINIWLLLPACTIGLLSVAVLNLNNMRDIDNDRLSSKNTIVVKLGLSRAKVFHYVIILFAVLAALGIQSLGYMHLIDLKVNDYSNWTDFLIFLPSIAFIPLIPHLVKVISVEKTTILDPELKKVALSTFFHAVLTLIVIRSIT
jgi:1,4-dihydroxy-2-naphthoate octaprenyltransferase